MVCFILIPLVLYPQFPLYVVHFVLIGLLKQILEFCTHCCSDFRVAEIFIFKFPHQGTSGKGLLTMDNLETEFGT